MWLFDNETVPNIRTELPGPRRQELLQHDDAGACRPPTRACIPWCCPRQRRGHRGCGRQPVPRLHRRHRRHVHGPLSPEGRRRHPGPGGQADPHVRHRFLLRAADRPGSAAGRDGAGQNAKRVFFTNSGAEALEAALKLARWHTGRSRAVAFFGAFHGRTYGAMSLSGSKVVHRRGFSPLVPDIHHVPFPRGCNGCQPATAVPVSSRSRKPFDASPRPKKSPPFSSSRSRARAVITCRRRVLARAARTVRPARHPAGRRRGTERHGPHRQNVRRRTLGRRAGHPVSGQGHRQRYAVRRDDRPRLDDGLAARQPRQHLRRQSR